MSTVSAKHSFDQIVRLYEKSIHRLVPDNTKEGMNFNGVDIAHRADDTHTKTCCGFTVESNAEALLAVAVDSTIYVYRDRKVIRHDLNMLEKLEERASVIELGDYVFFPFVYTAKIMRKLLIAADYLEEAAELTDGDVRLRYNVDIGYAREFRQLNPATSIALTIENTYLGKDDNGVDKIAYGVTVYVGERLIKADTKVPESDVILLSVW